MFRPTPVVLSRQSEITIVDPPLLPRKAQDAEPVRKAPVPGTLKNPRPEEVVKSRGLSYFTVETGQSEWVYPQYDHLEVEVIYDIESYAARATRAKLALFLKEGFEFVARDDKRADYIRARISQMERATCIPFDLLLFQVCRDLIVHSNAYWVKVRKESASGGRTRKLGKKEIKPVAGYFPLPPETMVPLVDTSNTIVSWKQVIGDSERIFSTDDIVHFYTNRKVGYPLGVPSIWPAIDDIRALRSLEANLDVLVHKHLFPVFLWKVGTETRPAQTYADGTTEISEIQSRVAEMPTEGSLVVSERITVDSIGAENKALRVEFYLKHYVERLLAGLDVSSIDVGIGDSSSRSTAQTLSRNLMDVVKLNQITIERFMESVIAELLLESTFSEKTIFDADNLVHLKFQEIDKEAKLANGNYLMDIFIKNGITHSEMRVGMGRDPLTPEEEMDLAWNKWDREKALITAGDETLVYKSAPTTTGPTSTKKPSGAVGNKNRPKNQHGTRKSPKLNRDSFVAGNNPDSNPILYWYNAIRDELQIRWAADNRLDLVKAEVDIRATFALAVKDMNEILHRIIREEYRDPETIYGIYKMADSRVESYVAKLERDLISQLKTSSYSPNVIFESLKFRAVLIGETERQWARNAASLRWLRKFKVDIEIVGSDTMCDVCRSKLTTIRADDRLEEVEIPPFHPLCGCGLKVVQ
jgi:hypothetical protein